MSEPSTPPRQVAHVHVEAPPTNGLGLAGFICAILGWLSCGVLLPVGLLLSFIAMFKPPRGFAIAGFVISLVGFIPVILVVVVIGLGTVLAGIGLGAAIMMQEDQFIMNAAGNEITVYYRQHGKLPSQAEGDKIASAYVNADGDSPRYTPTGSTTFELTLPGSDNLWGTTDDAVQSYDAATTAAPLTQPPQPAPASP